jgi:N-acetylmuramoyl-L-alanine amidase
MTHDWTVYALKVILFHGISYAAYWTLLRGLHHFTLNRIYLLCTLVLGFVAPFVMLPGAILAVEPLNEVSVIAGTFVEEQYRGDEASLVRVTDFSFAFYIFYCAGMFMLLLRSVWSVVIISRIRRRGIEDSSYKPPVVRISESMSFSFINTIFLGHSASSAVFLHEKGHIRGRHWIDLMLLEFTCVVFWINPFVWLYRRSLKQQHEYLADEYVLDHGISREGYLLCILDSLSQQEPIGPVHKFNSKSLKQRISMITNHQFSRYSKALYLVLIPLVAFLLFSFAGTTVRQTSVDAPKVFVIDAAHGGADAGATSSAGISEKEIALAVAKLVQQLGKERGLNIQMTRTTDQQLSLQERVTVSANAKADVFLSLHVGFDENRVAKGVEMHVSEENAKYAESRRMATLLSSEFAHVKEFSKPVVKNSKAFVLKNNAAASAIVEMGYLSDDDNAKFISDATNQKMVAESIVNALAKY